MLVIIYKLCSLFSASVELYTFGDRLNVVNVSENRHWDNKRHRMWQLRVYESAIDSTELQS